MARVALALIVLILAGAWGVVLLRERRPQGLQGQATLDPQVLMPIAGLYDAGDIGKELDWVQIAPPSRRKLWSQLLLPKSWERREVPVAADQQDDKQPTALLEAAPHGEDEALIEVRYVRVPAEVSLSRFIQGLVAISRYQVVAEEDRVLGGGKKVRDALLKMTSRQFGPTLTRMVVSRRGEYVLLVAGSSPAESFGKWARTFGAAALSLDP